MADSLLFQNKHDSTAMPALMVEGSHTPDALAAASAVYISAAGSAMLQNGSQALKPCDCWLWFAVESGNLVLGSEEITFSLRAGDCCMLPPASANVTVEVSQEARILWMMAILRILMSLCMSIPQMASPGHASNSPTRDPLGAIPSVPPTSRKDGIACSSPEKTNWICPSDGSPANLSIWRR